jgi:glycosyltransferase involved in cell wall biosynthesis
MSPRILIVSPSLEIGGTEMHLLRVIPELRRRGMDISLFVLSRGGRLEVQFVDKGVPVSGPSAGGARLLRNLRALAALRRELRRSRPDILHFFLTEPYFVGSIASIGMRDMIRVMSRRSLAVYQDRHPVLARLERRLHGATIALLGNSAAVVEQLVNECGVPDKVGLLYNGIEISPPVSVQQRAEARRRLAIPPEAFVILVSANLIPYKGHFDLFEAVGSAKAKFSHAWRLLLLGRDEGIGLQLRRQAAVLDFADNIVWLGEVSDVRTPLEAADVGILPSHQEGFSNSLLEMMAHGLAVIATDVGGNRDAIVDRESGMLVPAKRPDALAAAMAELYACADLRSRFGIAARSRAAACFSLERCVQRYQNLYSNITNATRAESFTVQQMIETPFDFVSR